MTRNQLPEGVGKKIVEALKRQAEADISPVEETNNTSINTVPLTEIEDLPEIKFNDLTEDADKTENVIVEEETPKMTFVEPEKPKMQEPIKSTVSETVAPVTQQAPVANTMFSASSFSQDSFKQQQPVLNSMNITLPANVQTLSNLINSLPSGVAKQTGAQIIRQTMEAMGIPMNNVLKEAQMFQEELNGSTRECMIKIQECKTQIMQLERSVQEYQQNITQINDIVSLFILTDKH
jgi:hypothetical protein